MSQEIQTYYNESLLEADYNILQTRLQNLS